MCEPFNFINAGPAIKICPCGLKAEFVSELQVDSSRKKKVIEGQIWLVLITPESLIENKQYQKMLMPDPLCENLGDQFRVAFHV